MTKLERVDNQIAKTKLIIAEQQERLRGLMQQKIELENKDFIKMVRTFKYSKEELQAMFERREKENENYNDSQTSSLKFEFNDGGNLLSENED